jgi:hypothetical protein
MRRANGASLPQRRDAAGTRSKARCGKSPCSSRKTGTIQARYSVTAGRDALGTIAVVNGLFTTIDPEGIVIGEFASLLAASRALPERGA